MTHLEKNPSGGNRTASKNSTSNLTGNSALTQRQRLLAALRKGRINTRDARNILDIYHPSARIGEMKKQGHDIVTHWEYVMSDCGQEHRIASYALLKEANV
jgi:hypothetical protein